MSKNIMEKRAIDKKCQYSIVIAVVKRAKELRRVTKEKNIPLNDISVAKTTYIKPLTVALEEFKIGKMDLKLRASIKAPEEKIAEPAAEVDTKVPAEADAKGPAEAG